ncbi:hypothetical protein [Aureimonas sp. AU40]|uniref:hypothetical protein n=1 Tax=Aureimonas sp. AU40 TaxID=1637747 RepID=UPI000781B2C0|nr:hypothetical protein [Aureimonas sp. AU40]
MVKVFGEVPDTLLEVPWVPRDRAGFAARLADAIEEFERPSLSAMLTEVLSRLDAKERRLDAMAIATMSPGESVGTSTWLT